MNPTSAADRRKRFGQVLTPPTVAALMADWVMGCEPKDLLDPAFGKGALVEACLNIDRSIKVVGYEIDPFMVDEIAKSLKEVTQLIVQDFLEASTIELFDAIIANPPYIRHRELKGNLNQRAGLSLSAGCVIPKSANQYSDFLVKSTLHLKVGGRAAFLIPAEWMSANFSAQIKRYLIDKNLLHSLVTFSNCSNVFGDALTTASLVLIEKSDKPIKEIYSYYLQSIDALNTPQSMADLSSFCGVRIINSADLREAAKWEPLLRGDDAFLPIGWTRLGELVSTSRGIATGANSFFLIGEGSHAMAQINPSHLLRCVGRSNDVQGLIFNDNDFSGLLEQKAKVWLVNFSECLSAAEREYIKEGEMAGFHERFITRSRRSWYSMEQRKPAPIWAGVFGRGDLRFVYNEAGVRSLTNFHSVYPRLGGPNFSRALVAVLNSRVVRSFMVSHQRGYGGGLMKFEPKDLLAIPIPDLRLFSDELICELADQLLSMHQSYSNGSQVSSCRVDEIISKFGSKASGVEFRLVG